MRRSLSPIDLPVLCVTVLVGFASAFLVAICLLFCGIISIIRIQLVTEWNILSLILFNDASETADVREKEILINRT